MQFLAWIRAIFRLKSSKSGLEEAKVGSLEVKPATHKETALEMAPEHSEMVNTPAIQPEKAIFNHFTKKSDIGYHNVLPITSYK